MGRQRPAQTFSDVLQMFRVFRSLASSDMSLQLVLGYPFGSKAKWTKMLDRVIVVFICPTRLGESHVPRNAKAGLQPHSVQHRQRDPLLVYSQSIFVHPPPRAPKTRQQAPFPSGQCAQPQPGRVMAFHIHTSLPTHHPTQSAVVTTRSRCGSSPTPFTLAVGVSLKQVSTAPIRRWKPAITVSDAHSSALIPRRRGWPGPTHVPQTHHDGHGNAIRSTGQQCGPPRPVGCKRRQPSWALSAEVVRSAWLVLL